MHSPRRARDANRFAQEAGFLGDALDQMNRRTRRLRQGAGQDDAGKAAARSEVDPDTGLGHQRQELKRIGDVPSPQLVKR